jgi:SAM-dependent methyltransferase
MSDIAEIEQVREEGRSRLYPSLTDPSWLVLRKRREVFTQWLGRLNHTNAVVLDVGGRIQPYRSLINGRLSRYIAVDLRLTPLVDIAGNAAQLPIRNDCFDLVFCTQMLEYPPEPRHVIAEIHRVLKPGGFLLLSAPAVHPQDSDQDSWRFLPGALHELLKEFSPVDLVPEGGSVTGFIRTINLCLVSFAPVAAFRGLFRFTIVPKRCGADQKRCQLKCQKDEGRKPVLNPGSSPELTSTRFTSNYGVVVVLAAAVVPVVLSGPFKRLR